MQWPKAVRASVYGVALSLCLAMVGASDAEAQTNSDIDTLRVERVSFVIPNEEFDLDISVRNTFVLDAFNFRIRYDTSVIEPIPDTTINGSDTLIEYPLEFLREAEFGIVSASVPEPGIYIGTVQNPIGQPPVPLQPGGGPTVRARWRVHSSAPPGGTTVAFEDDPQLPLNYNVFSDTSGNQLLFPVQSRGVVVVVPECDCIARGDVNGNTLAYDVGDAIFLSKFLFHDALFLRPPLPGCDVNTADVDCSGRVDIVDLLSVLSVIVGTTAPDNLGCPPCVSVKSAPVPVPVGTALDGGSR